MDDLATVIQEHQRQDGWSWIFGDYPTILDAHAGALVARLMDMERYDLIPGPVKAYGRGIMESPEWNKTTHGRPTVWNVSLGHVSDLTPL